MRSLRDLILSSQVSDDDALSSGDEFDQVHQRTSSVDEDSSRGEDDDQAERAARRPTKPRTKDTQQRKKKRRLPGVSEGSLTDRLLLYHGLASVLQSANFCPRLKSLGAISLSADPGLSWRCASKRSWAQSASKNPRSGDASSHFQQVEDLRRTTLAVMRRSNADDIYAALVALSCCLRSSRKFDLAAVECALECARFNDEVRACTDRWLMGIAQHWKKPQIPIETLYKEPRQGYYYQTYAPPSRDERAMIWLAATQVCWLGGSNARAIACLDWCATETTPHDDKRITFNMHLYRVLASALQILGLGNCPYEPRDEMHLDDILNGLDNLQGCVELEMHLDNARKVSSTLALNNERLALLEAACRGRTKPRAALQALCSQLTLQPASAATRRALVRLLAHRPSHPAYARSVLAWIEVDSAAGFYGLPEEAARALSEHDATAAVTAPWPLHDNDQPPFFQANAWHPLAFKAAAVHVAFFVCRDKVFYEAHGHLLWYQLAIAVYNFVGTSVALRRVVFFATGHVGLWNKYFFDKAQYFDGPNIAKQKRTPKGGEFKDDDLSSLPFFEHVSPKLLSLGFKYLVRPVLLLMSCQLIARSGLR